MCFFSGTQSPPAGNEIRAPGPTGGEGQDDERMEGECSPGMISLWGQSGEAKSPRAASQGARKV